MDTNKREGLGGYGPLGNRQSLKSPRLAQIQAVGREVSMEAMRMKIGIRKMPEIVAILKLMADYERVQKEVRDARRTT